MARSAGISGVGVAAATAGGLLMYAGIRDVPLLDALKQITSGSVPAPAVKESAAVTAARARLDSGSAPGAAADSGEAYPASASGAPNAWLAKSALTRKGMPYVWGATGPTTFDCSGLVQWAFAQNGIKCPRTTYQQQPWSMLTKIPAASAAAGDLVFWPGHVAIVVAPGMVVHAPRPGKVVEVVPVEQAGPRGQTAVFKRYTGSRAPAAKAAPKSAWT